MGIKIICDNRKVRFNYEILETWEAGMVLTGSEVKSLRNGGANIGDAYAVVQGGEILLLNVHISPYKGASYNNHEPLRTRKLLLHQHQIKKLIGQVQEKGLTLIPLKMYFKDGRAKVELGLGKSKKKFDKRATIKKREEDKQIRRVMKEKNRL